MIMEKTHRQMTNKKYVSTHMYVTHYIVFSAAQQESAGKPFVSFLLFLVMTGRLISEIVASPARGH